MAIEMVNGYACANCSDAALAKQGVDPAKASSLAEAARVEKIEKSEAGLTPDAVSATAEAARARVPLDYIGELDVLV